MNKHFENLKEKNYYKTYYNLYQKYIYVKETIKLD